VKNEAAARHFHCPKEVHHYLLTWRQEDDKSEFLARAVARAGYTLERAGQLEEDLRRQLLPLEAELLDHGEYGDKHVIRGRLKGPVAAGCRSSRFG